MSPETEAHETQSEAEAHESQQEEHPFGDPETLWIPPQETRQEPQPVWTSRNKKFKI